MEGSLRLCFVSLTFAPWVGGSEVQAEKQARSLQARGHSVTVVTLRYKRYWPRAEVLHGLPIIRCGGVYRGGGQLRIGRLGIWLACLAVLPVLWRLRHDYDVLHVFQLTPLAAVAALVGQLARKPVVIMVQSAGPSEHQRVALQRGASLMAGSLADTSYLTVGTGNWAVSGDLYYLPRSALGGQVLPAYLRRSGAYYHALSRRCREELVAHGYRADRIVTIPGGVDTTSFQPLAQRPPGPASAKSTMRAVVCVARLEYPKGVDVLLHAWARMMLAPPHWRGELTPRLRVVGDGTLRPKLERLAAELGIADTVEFAGQRRDIVELLQQAWGFVLPSRWEGMPNALLEGMACGLPGVATRVSGSEDVISDGDNGLLVEPEQPVDMARALRRIIEDTELAQRLGREARATILREYQLDAVVSRWVQCYRGMLDRCAPRPAAEMDCEATGV